MFLREGEYVVLDGGDGVVEVVGVRMVEVGRKLDVGLEGEGNGLVEVEKRVKSTVIERRERERSAQLAFRRQSESGERERKREKEQNVH